MSERNRAGRCGATEEEESDDGAPCCCCCCGMACAWSEIRSAQVLNMRSGEQLDLLGKQ